VAKIRQLFNHVDVETAKRQRLCHHNRSKHSIAQDERCLVIKQSDGARKNYCVGCATDILDRAENDLAELRAKIGSAR
jgi:hypothetical protein